LIELDREEYDVHQLIPYVPIGREGTTGKWVDIVVNNLDEKGHPFHLVRRMLSGVQRGLADVSI